jgi:hypothetical protein
MSDDIFQSIHRVLEMPEKYSFDKQAILASLTALCTLNSVNESFLSSSLAIQQFE